MSTSSGEPDGRGAEPRTVRVSDSLQARLDSYLEQDAARTTTSVTFDAIDHLGANLPELLELSHARLASPFAERAEAGYLGAGLVQIRLWPSPAEAKLLDRLSTKLGLPWHTWLPPVLNAYLPGRREPDNMPWLLQEHDEGVSSE